MHPTQVRLAFSMPIHLSKANLAFTMAIHLTKRNAWTLSLAHQSPLELRAARVTEPDYISAVLE